MFQEKIEIGEYTTSDHRILNIYATFRRGGINIHRMPVKPGYGFNLDIDGRGKLWFWTDWPLFADEVNKIAGESILDPGSNPWCLAPLGDDMVAEDWWCPDCNEGHADMLAIQDDGIHVSCLQCGGKYALP